MANEVLKWKNEVEGSFYKKMYNEYTMPFDLYLEKYFSNSNYLSWSKWEKWFDFIDSAFDEEKSQIYKSKSGFYKIDFVCRNYTETLNQLLYLQNIPIDIRKVIAFLIEDGFFKFYNIKVDDWILKQNFDNPKKENVDEKAKSIKELVASESSINYLKEKFINLDWWQITRGDAQGT
jgi:hypothetical protein